MLGGPENVDPVQFLADSVRQDESPIRPVGPGSFDTGLTSAVGDFEAVQQACIHPWGLEFPSGAAAGAPTGDAGPKQGPSSELLRVFWKPVAKLCDQIPVLLQLLATIFRRQQPSMILRTLQVSHCHLRDTIGPLG